MLSHILIFHGRRICFARKPACDDCGDERRRARARSAPRRSAASRARPPLHSASARRGVTRVSTLAFIDRFRELHEKAKAGRSRAGAAPSTSRRVASSDGSCSSRSR